MEKITRIFDEYVYGYDMNESPISLKYQHSYRVMNICKEIAQDLNLNEEDTKLAMIIGLLHDYARFEQWKQFKTFDDALSIDHGDLAVKMLFANNEIEKFENNDLENVNHLTLKSLEERIIKLENEIKK